VRILRMMTAWQSRGGICLASVAPAGITRQLSVLESSMKTSYQANQIFRLLQNLEGQYHNDIFLA
jgi:hypothetical protein